MLDMNRNYVIETDGSIHKMLFCGDADWDERAETTLDAIMQEVRAKAIDEVFDFLKTQRDKKYMKVNLDDLEIRKYKEQLKESGSVE